MYLPIFRVKITVYSKNKLDMWPCLIQRLLRDDFESLGFSLDVEAFWPKSWVMKLRSWEDGVIFRKGGSI